MSLVQDWALDHLLTSRTSALVQPIWSDVLFARTRCRDCRCEIGRARLNEVPHALLCRSCVDVRLDRLAADAL